jgi:hypothetical protein
MSNIGGKKRENTSLPELVKKVGLFEATVIAVNPNLEEFKKILDIELKEDSKITEYLGITKDGNKYIRLDFWLEEVKNKDKFKVTFFLEDRERENKDGTKKQYINNVGVCAWADDPNNLPEWFSARDYRVAYIGEEEFYNFMRTWLSQLDYREAETVLQLDWKKLLKGNVRDIETEIDGEWCNNIVALATISTREKDGEIKEYQNIYNKAFLPQYTLKQFRIMNYAEAKVQENLKAKKPKDLKTHERFVLNVTGEYGCKDYFILKDIEEYNPEDNIAASDKVISEDGDDY